MSGWRRSSKGGTKMDRFLTLLGLARRAGRLELGETPVYEALSEGRCRAVFLAQDAADNTRDRLENRRGEVPLYSVPFTKEELGRALGRESCAMAATGDAGFREGLLKALRSKTHHHDGGVTI